MASGKQLTVAQPARKTPVDISQHSNLAMNLENSLDTETKYVALLQQVSEREAAARHVLALGDDAPRDERDRAEGLLLRAREDRTNLEEALERVRRQIAALKAQMAPLEAEVQRQQKIRSATAALG